MNERDMRINKVVLAIYDAIDNSGENADIAFNALLCTLCSGVTSEATDKQVLDAVQVYLDFCRKENRKAMS